MLRPPAPATSLIVSVILAAVLLGACGKNEQGKAAQAERPLLIAPEDVLTIKSDALASGPVINGSIQPERRADLRAEVSAIVLQVLKENGDAVKRGDLLVRLDDTAIRDSLTSSEEAARAASQTFEQSERQLQRLKTLRASGMASAQQLEDAEIRRNNAQSDLVAAKARSVQARQQLQRTEVRAPFDGIVSERKVSAGDTAQVGKELVKVIDPASMRFEGFVSADKVGEVKAGQVVHFRANGYAGQEFAGKVARVDPAANPTTRQVAVLVKFADGSQPRVAGLYAEGSVETGAVQGMTIPEAALVRNGDNAFAWRVKDGKLNKTPLTLGERDPRRGDVIVREGLAAGDKVVRNPVTTLKDGQAVELAAAPSPGAAASNDKVNGSSAGAAANATKGS
ncbi:efflux RND transporter periplasmic adaptor subunit [Noviherbaspirillum galbum]|uniref:Efflux RND transporter periplasmic adaptor subunit n=1 Tax=Noviherbaspirillum galbum TaxID=2709383 RepID=A0A6B3STQ9_9BURK|nr:efflux RND transporter periplasmic adaptor subunit [Noviherbaspirillum galbum]NEX61019.1 efflux RND transporter periplasmic adaptor subunit [Noviherbaspirillum galbum]